MKIKMKLNEITMTHDLMCQVGHNRQIIWKRKFIFFLTGLFFLVLGSCGIGEKSYPEQVFERVALNGNKIPNGFKRHFNEIRAQLKAGSLTIVTQKNEVKKVGAVAYVENHYVRMFDADIKSLKELESKAETAQILTLALDMFTYVDQIYKVDFPRIAKMIDEGKPDVEIDAAIAELDSNKGGIIDEKFNAVHDLIIPYADKHGVEYKMLNMP